MKPCLTLTAPGSADTSAAPLSPVELHRLVDGTSSDLEQQIATLSDAASTLIHGDTDTSTLLDYLEQYCEALLALRPRLNDQLVGLMLPPNPEDTAFYNQCSELYARMASVCKRVILTAPDDVDAKDTDGISRACYWAIYFIGEHLRCAYATYHHVPTESWYEVHQIYQYSLSEHIATRKIHFDGAKARNIRHIYIRVLLMGICDPYNFPFRTVHSIFRATDEWSKLVQLSATPNQSNSCLFLIDPNTDRPAMPVLANARLQEDIEVLYLDTTDLVSELNNNLDSAQRTTPLRGQPRERIVGELESRDVLKKVILAWGTHPIRGLGRQPDTKKCDILVGLASISSVLGQQENVPVIGNPIRRRLELIDHSERGVRARVDAADDVHIRVGELVALNQGPFDGDEDDWFIGMIRWAQTTPDGDFHVGIYKLLDDVLPVSVSHIPMEDGDVPVTYPVAGLWMVRNRKDTKRTSVIVNNNLYRPRDNIRVERGKTKHNFEIRHVVLSTRSFIWFDVSLSNSTPEHSAELVHPRFEA